MAAFFLSKLFSSSKISRIRPNKKIRKQNTIVMHIATKLGSEKSSQKNIISAISIITML